MAKDSTKQDKITAQERKLVDLFRHIKSNVERRAFIVLVEALAFGALTK